MAGPQTLIDKIWMQHVVRELSDGRFLLHIDRHLIHDGSSRQAFDGLRRLKRRFRNPQLNLGVIDHIVSTLPGRNGETHPAGRERIHALRDNCAEFGIELYDVDSARQGIVHVIAPELGLALPGTTLVCGDSHTATNGGIGALAWGIGTTEVMHVMATQALLQRKPKQMRICFNGAVKRGVYPKDLILYVIGRHGVAAASGHAIEYGGSAMAAMAIEGRLTVCNMSIELGARMGIVAPDECTIDYLADRPFAPRGTAWDEAVRCWRTLFSDDDATFDRTIDIDCNAVGPQVTWGISPQHLVAVDEPVPDPALVADGERRALMDRALAYMGLEPGRPIEGLPIDYAFIGSCTNSRLSDLQEAAAIVRGRRVPPGVTALVVPGSMQVKAAAEQAGLDKTFIAAGFEWRNAGCSMCVGSNGDSLAPGKRLMSTANRNFEDRPGVGARTHLASPAMVAAAAISGRIVDVRKLLR
jgi:3-isopropylmalate/(R)-2-methylmalate dehydratase large subunit